MPLGIISESEFESELNNCSDITNSSSIITPRDSNIFNSNSGELINSSDILIEDNQQAPNPAIISAKPRGRGESNLQVPPALRKVIGETAAIEGRADALDLADRFGISPSSVSAYKVGAHSTSTINEPNIDTLSHINKSKLRVTKRATHRLNLALSHITEDKLAEAKVGEIASVAKSMAGIIKDMSPEDDSNKNKSNIPFVVFAPIIRNELSYEVVHAKDDY
jgi:hypothetical protein